MSRNARFRRPYHKQHVKQCQTLSKSVQQQHSYHTSWSIWMKFSRRMSLLMIHKILGLFVNKLASVDKNSLLNRDNLAQPIQMILSNKKRLFLHSWLHFWNLDQIKTFSRKTNKKKGLVGYVFFKIRTRRNVVR